MKIVLVFLILILKISESPNCFRGLVQIHKSEASKQNWNKEILKNSKIPFKPHSAKGFGSYLAMNINYLPIKKLFDNVQSITKQKLKSRGEAHITVITPPEYRKVLEPAGVTIAEIDKIALASDIQGSSLKLICIGSGSKLVQKENAETYFIVLESKNLILIRKKISDLFMQKGGDPKMFNPLNFYPHITLGFSKRDLHLSDGIIKNTGSCLGKKSTAKDS